MMSLDVNKQVVKDFHQAIMIERNLNVIAQFLRDPFVDHSVPSESGSIASYTHWLQSYLTVFPDFAAQIEDLTAENDLVVCRLSLSGTQQAEYMGASASWKSFSVSGLQIYRIADGKIVERWSWIDTMGLRAQLGIVN